MKKITFIFLLFILPFIAKAQSLEISFESNESYTLGDLHSQNNWTTTGCGTDCNVENQVISADDSTDGDWSLKLTTESEFGGQSNGPIIGGFYALPEAVERDGMTFSYDFKISDGFNGNGNDYRFAMIGPDENNDLFLGFLLDFSFNGNIRVINNSVEFETVSTWTEGVWYNIKVETTSTEITYFIDGESLGTFNLLTEVDFTSFRFVHDNYGGEALIDNIKINAEDEDANCDHDQLWLVGAGVTQAGWGWDSPVALPCTGDNVYSGIVEFTPLSDGNDGNFRFFTDATLEWSSPSFNFTYFEAEEFSIDSRFENAEDDDNNFLFTGTQGEYLLTVDFTNKTIVLDENLNNEDFVQVNFDFFVNNSGLNLSASEMITTVEVYNLSGKRVLDNKFDQLNGVINLDQLSRGIYLARVQIGTTTKTVKFVK